MSRTNTRDLPNNRQARPPAWRKIVKGALALFLPLVVLAVAATTAGLVFTERAEGEALQNEERHAVELQIAGIDEVMAEISSDLMILANGRMMEELWDDEGTPVPETIADLSEDYLDFSKFRRLYDQVRLIDQNGNELVRVNFDNGHPGVVPSEALQNKKGRYYFDTAFSLERDEVFVSPLDLNIEHDEIEWPLKPMIRFATPVFDRHGEKRGIVLLNYFGERLLEHFIHEAPELKGRQAMLLNDDGYWLKGPNPEDEWGFMYEDRVGRSFATTHPEAWERISSEESSQFESPEGLFTSGTAYPLIESQRSSAGSGEAFAPSKAQLTTSDYSWKVVSFVPSEFLYASRHTRRTIASLVLAGVTLAMLLGSWRLARAVVFRTEAAEMLRDSEERFRVLAEMLPETVFEADLNLDLTFANQRSFEMFGYSKEDLARGLNALEMIAPEDRDRARAEVVRHLKGGEHGATEYQAVRKDGSRFPVLFHTNTIMKEGEPLGVRGIIVDIFERKRVEAERELLMAAIEHAAETVIITDVEATIKYVNPAFERITGYTREEAIGRSPSIFQGGKQNSAFYQELWQTLTRGETWSGRFINRKKDGTLYTEEATISPVRDASGQTVNYVAVKRDITEEIKLQDQFRQAQKMEAVGQLAGGVAHDFNNLLQVINGYSELALTDLDSEHPAFRCIEEVVKAGKRATTLVSQLLAFSRRQVLDMRDVNLNDLIANLMSMIRRLIGEHITLDLIAAHDLGTVRADPGQIEQILMNLCVNARDAMADGGTIIIETSNVRIDEAYCRTHPWAEPGRFVLLNVTDTGCGMDAETLANVFEPFFTTKDVGEGSGLGLSTVYGLVKQHKGMVEVSSKIDTGTTFEIYLPLTERSAAVVGDRITSVAPGGTETILLAEDDESVLGLARSILAQAGYTVVTAVDGEDALHVFEEHAAAIDLALLDAMMPKLSGREVFEHIRGRRPEIRVLFSSGYSMDTIHTNFVLDEGMQLIQKPYQRDTLLRRVREALDS